jgi:hypothetical protein
MSIVETKGDLVNSSPYPATEVFLVHVKLVSGKAGYRRPDDKTENGKGAPGKYEEEAKRK